jgi:adenylate cyclase
MKLRGKALLLFTAMTLGPVLIAVALLIRVNRAAVRVSEETVQSAVLAEVAAAPTRTLREVEADAVAIAAIFGRAVAGAIKDEDAMESVRALIATRATLDAVRFEVPAAKLSTLIRREGSSDDVPSAPPELRAVADERGVAFDLASAAAASAKPRAEGALDGLVVVRIQLPKGVKAEPGYVVARARLEALGAELRAVAERRFGGHDVRLLIATHDRRAVASFGVEGASPGASVAGHPLWASLPSGTPWTQRVGVVAEHEEQGVRMVGAIETVPDLGWAVAIWRPEPVAYAALAEMREKGTFVAVGAALLGLLVALVASRGVTGPILALSAQAKLIGERRWSDLSLVTERTDEIGDLGRSFRQMSTDLEKGEEEIARQAKLRGDLGRFMSKPLVDAIVKGDHSLSLGGKRAPISVLFADVVGFTPLAESREAEQVVALLNELFSVLTEIVFRHGGTVDKFIGDCLMAVWGAPVPQEDHAARALAAAEDMMRFLETANEEWREKYDVEIRLGIGVNSGEAIVGNIGSDKRMEYTVIGDVVNVAARLEAIAAPNQVLVAETTKELAGDAFVLQHLGAKKLTGRKNETAVYLLETA